MNKVFLGIGSNINPHKAIEEALVRLQDAFGQLGISPTFESESVGFDGDNFLNLVVSFESDQSLESIIKINKAIEDASGRDRTGPKFSARSLDIDILLYGDICCETPIYLPRGEILENAYVLWPLSILAPEMLHPETGESFAKHWKEYDLEQKLWQIER